MKVIINNLILAINNLAAAINKKNSSHTTTSNPYYTYPSTSNPYSSNVRVTSYYQTNSKSVTISAEEYDALKAVYKAFTEKGNYPKHHDHVARELKTKWPTLNKALNQLVEAYDSKLNPSVNKIWKETK